jgi:hypothetical protein
VIIKVYLRYLRKYLLGCMYQESNLSLHVTERYTLGTLGIAISYTACKHVVNEFNHKTILNYGTSKEYFLRTRLNKIWWYRRSNLRQVKYHEKKEVVYEINWILDILVKPNDLCWIVESIINFQVPLFIIDQRCVSIICPHILKPASHTLGSHQR